MLALGPIPRIFAKQAESPFLILAALVVVGTVSFSMSNADLVFMVMTTTRIAEKLSLF
jgi:hypothetical protein